MDNKALAVIGAGSWGTALALLFAENGEQVMLCARDAAKARAMEEARCNTAYLPHAYFPSTLHATADLEQTVKHSQDILLVCPSSVFRHVLKDIKAFLPPGSKARIAWATKGLEPDTSRFLHEVVKDVFGDVPMAIISGPTFAKEVASHLPTAVTVASNLEDFGRELAQRMDNDFCRVYTSDDLIGVQFGGAVKNVLAIAAGIADGLGFGANARAALITRGLAELMRLGTKLGGRRDTLMGLTGLGDLILTCTDNQSRNRQMGLALAQGLSIKQAQEKIQQAVEGIHAAGEILALAQKHHIELPIIEQVNEVIQGRCSPKEAVQRLLQRAVKPE